MNSCQYCTAVVLDIVYKYTKRFTRDHADSLNEPFPSQILREVPVTKGGVNYTYVTVKYNTVTRSGYDVERISYIAATVRQRRLYTLVATVSSERRNKMDLELNAIRASFRVGDAGMIKAFE